jgi:hypothetical protein
MSASIKNNRVTVYFSNRKDAMLIDELTGVEAGDVGWFIKELMKDGIKYRKGTNNVNTAPVTSTTMVNDISQNTGASFDSLFNMDVQKKELSNEETEDLFDKL